MVVAEFDGGQLMSDEVIPAYNDQLTTAIFAGHSADEVAESTLNAVMEQLAGDKIIAAQAKELGLTELSDADLEQINAQAAANYERQINDYLAFTGEGDRDAAVQQLTENGITLESITDQLKQNWWSQKFYDYTVKDVTVTDEDVQARYDALLRRAEGGLRRHAGGLRIRPPGGRRHRIPPRGLSRRAGHPDRLRQRRGRRPGRRADGPPGPDRWGRAGAGRGQG